MGFAACVAVVVSLCLRGSVTRLAALRLRAVWLMFVALAAQVLVITVLVDLPEDVVRVAHGLTYVIAGVFLVLNLRVPGLPLLGLGTACNAVTIALNGGVLPASAAATAAAGWSAEDPQFANSDPALENPRLAVLGDNFVTPDWVPFSNVYSIGDVLIVLGVFVLVYRASRRPPAADVAAEVRQPATV
jgi:Family of unknown function (DUF5317)